MSFKLVPSTIYIFWFKKMWLYNLGKSQVDKLYKNVSIPLLSGWVDAIVIDYCDIF